MEFFLLIGGILLLCCLVTLTDYYDSNAWLVIVFLSLGSISLYFIWLSSTEMTYQEVDIHTTTINPTNEKEITIQYIIRPEKSIDILHEGNNIILVDTTITKMECTLPRKGSLGSIWTCNIVPK